MSSQVNLDLVVRIDIQFFSEFQYIHRIPDA